MILQGPVTYQVNSVNSGYLPVGKLTGKIATSNAKGFTVRTPTATVIDVGTEFGVEVGETGETTSHVFRGAVNLVTMTASGESTGFILSQNASARVERSREHHDNPIVVPCGSAKPEQFVREDQFLPFLRWQSQNQNLRRTPAMLAHYDFQQRNGSAIVLPGAGPKGGHSLDGTIKNATWCDGPMLGRRALEFSSPADYVWLNIAKSSDSLTLAAWVYVDSLESDLSGLLMSESAQPAGAGSLGDPAQWKRRLRHSGGSGRGATADSVHALDRSRLAAALDASGGHLRSPLASGMLLSRRSHRQLGRRDGQPRRSDPDRSGNARPVARRQGDGRRRATQFPRQNQ